MNWTKKESSFTYSGTPVKRRSYTAHTPLGEFKAYEAISGRIFYNHPFRNKNVQNGVTGMAGYQPDPFNEIMPNIGIPAKTLKEAIQKCEEVWQGIQLKIASC